ncbi:hypothetical protein [Nocardia paucivorans]|uniref:hypothetical protein n=1 Tax=Nocardia paucivorans TaxID=114259 RepID=UPI0002D97AAA|nr:hypothetical protein [Nocardia paucivorans]
MTEIGIDPTAEARSGVWAPGWPHEAPEVPFDRFEAHAAMQAHIDCDVLSCARKRAAWATLVALGAIVPDAGRSS